MRQRRNGFSLIELLIVVAIILVIASIAIPNFLRAKIAANEASAVSSVHAVNTAEVTYSSMNPTIGYSAKLSDLGPGVGDFIDGNLAGGHKGAYKFLYAPGPGPPYLQYVLNADPDLRFITGQRSFYSDESNITRYNENAVAGPGDPAIQ